MKTKFSTATTIDTTRLLLRPLVSTDAHALHKIMSDAEVVRYWNTEPWKCTERAYKAINDCTNAIKAGNQLTLGLFRKSDTKLIGTCHLFHIVKNSRRANLGYGLCQEAWGKGYMREALYEFLGFAFTNLNLNRVQAEIDPHDQSSVKLLQRLGFNKDGYLKQQWIVHGEPSDSELYGLLAEEWAIKQKQNKIA